jgi:hypothetical protein
VTTPPHRQGEQHDISDGRLRSAWRHVSSQKLMAMQNDPRESIDVNAKRRRVAILRGLIESESSPHRLDRESGR